MDQNKIIKKALELFREGKLEEYKNFILENLQEFSEEVQKEIIASLVEAEIIKETARWEKLNQMLEEFLEILSNRT